jgi:hypothetical protein
MRSNHDTLTPAWWAERLPIITAFAEGKTILFNGEKCGGALGFMNDASEYSIAPPTITVNGFEVPVPETVAPEGKYFVPNVYDNDFVNDMFWNGAACEDTFLRRGLVYLNKDHAIARAKAMLGIDPEGK